MGVPGLWEILNKAGKSTSLAHLAAVDGFAGNKSKRRGYRVGIDVSIWLHHSAFSKGGENCEIRNLFFRLVFLSKLSLIPVFVFDGRQRPKVKRGSRLGKSGSHGLSKDFKEFIVAFGMEWHEAPAEAEAELAVLNRQGYIDAIMTDDCDAFLFGAQTIMKNISKNLSGNKSKPALNQNEKTDTLHTMLYNAEDFKKDPEIGLTRGGMILFALLAGGDYDDGLPNFGKVIAHALARCKFGDELLEASENLQGQDLQEFLMHWRGRVNAELRNNTHGFLKHRTSLSIPNDFPKLDVLANYVSPICSRGGCGAALRDNKQIDIAEIGRLCEKFFEWGYESRIIERFKTLIWPSAVMHVLRRAALEVDEKRKTGRGCQDVGTPAAIVKRYLVNGKEPRGNQDRMNQLADVFVRREPVVQSSTTTLTSPANVPDPTPLITGIRGKARQHASTDGVLEYRVEILPTQLVNIVKEGLKRTREVPATAQEKDADPNAPLLLWIPAVMLDLVHPTMVESFLSKEPKKKAKGKQRVTEMSDSEREERPAPSTSQANVRSTPGAGVRKDNNVDALHFSNPNDLHDSWFRLNSSKSTAIPSLPRNGFLFTFPNPDFEDADGEGEPKEMQAAMEMDIDVEDSFPKTRFDRIVDQILDAPLKKRKLAPPKQKKRKEAPGSQNASERPRTKKPRPTNLLDVLDALSMDFT